MILSNIGTEYRDWTQQGPLGIVFALPKNHCVMSLIEFGIFSNFRTT